MTDFQWWAAHGLTDADEIKEAEMFGSRPLGDVASEEIVSDDARTLDAERAEREYNRAFNESMMTDPWLRHLEADDE